MNPWNDEHFKDSAKQAAALTDDVRVKALVWGLLAVVVALEQLAKKVGQ